MPVPLGDPAQIILGMSKPQEIKYTVAYRSAAVNIGGAPSNPVKVGELFALNLWLEVPDSRSRPQGETSATRQSSPNARQVPMLAALCSNHLPPQPQRRSDESAL